MPDASTVESFDGLRTCSACGYLLRGLPPGSRCPECGQLEPADQITLRGWNRSLPRTPGFADIALRLLPVAVLAGFAAALDARLGWVVLVVGSLVATTTFYPFIARGVLQLIHRAEHPPLQLHLSPHGFRVQFGRWQGRWRMWEARWRVVTKGPTRRGRCWVIVRPINSWALLLYGSQKNILAFDFDSDAEKLSQVREQIERWISQRRIGHAFEVLPVATTREAT